MGTGQQRGVEPPDGAIAESSDGATDKCSPMDGCDIREVPRREQTDQAAPSWLESGSSVRSCSVLPSFRRRLITA